MSDFIHREADYAIRIIAYIAGVDRQVKISELTDSIFLSKPTIVKITHQLKKCGILNTKTGRYGGLSLGADIKILSLYDILVCMGFKSSLNICIDKPEECRLNPICDITTFFAELQADLILKLQNAKIKDFIFDEKSIKALKSIYKEGGKV